MGRLPPWTRAAQFHRGPFERDSVEHSPREGSGIWDPCPLFVESGSWGIHCTGTFSLPLWVRLLKPEAAHRRERPPLKENKKLARGGLVYHLKELQWAEDHRVEGH